MPQFRIQVQKLCIEIGIRYKQSKGRKKSHILANLENLVPAKQSTTPNTMPVTARTVRAHGGSLLIACRVLSTSSVVLNPPTSTEENILSKGEVDVGDGVDEPISGGPSGFLRESIVGDAVGCQDGG
jgi:hypothetical protein